MFELYSVRLRSEFIVFRRNDLSLNSDKIYIFWSITQRRYTLDTFRITELNQLNI